MSASPPRPVPPGGDMPAATRRPLQALLVDPSLFTGPYDAGLTEGLLAAGVQPVWAIRPTRPGDRDEIPRAHVDDFFYRRVDTMNGLPGPLRVLAKGLAHALGLWRLVRRVRRKRPDVVHLQWLVLPPLDALACALMRRHAPLVLTMHDTVPFNGSRQTFVQRIGIDRVLGMVDAIVVHTRTGHERLLRQGIDAARLAVIPHGPLALRVPMPPQHGPRDPRATFVLFGEIKPYKGLDLLIEALASLPAGQRAQCRLIVAGRPRMELEPLRARIGELGLDGVIDLRAQRQTEEQMAVLFAEADCFVFPYRQIDASGVYFLVRSLGRWLVASRVGIFAEDLRDGEDGRLIEPESVPDLARALGEFITRRPSPAPAPADASWAAIGRSTRALYERTIARRHATARSSPEPAADLEERA